MKFWNIQKVVQRAPKRSDKMLQANKDESVESTLWITWAYNDRWVAIFVPCPTTHKRIPVSRLISLLLFLFFNDSSRVVSQDKTGGSQVWSLTKFYSVNFFHSWIIAKSVFKLLTHNQGMYLLSLPTSLHAEPWLRTPDNDFSSGM